MVIKRTILLFWALFFSLVFLTDLADGLKALAILPEDWLFASTNFGFMLELMDIYGTPVWLVAVLFAGVIVWAGAAALLFWRSFASFRAWQDSDDVSTQWAFALGIGLWGAFLVGDEFFLTFLSSDVNAVHLRLFIAQVVSLLVVALVPQGTGQARTQEPL